MASTNKTLAEMIASYGVSLKYEDIPPETVHKAKGLLIDSIGCGLGAYASEPAKIARSMAGRVRACDLPASILGSAQPSSLEMATFANGVMIRYMDFNDGYQGKGGGHPSDNVAPVLTCADALGASGRECIVALVLAYEIYCRLADEYEVYERGFDHSVNGVISCTMGAAKIFGLSQEETVQALNLAVAANISLAQTRIGEVSMWKGVAMGNAARNAVFAVMLAREGMTGPGPIFEGRYGFFNAITEPFSLKELGGKGIPFRMMDAGIKRYACGNLAQTTIDAAITLRSQIARVEDIERVRIEVCSRARGVMAGDPEKWLPHTPESADHSMPYVVAIALLFGTVERRHFAEEYLHNPELRALMQKITVESTEACDKLLPDACATRMEIVTKSGETFTDMVKYHKGHFRNPLTDQEIEQKFLSLTKDLLSPAQRNGLLALCWNLEAAEDINRLFRLTRI